MPLTVLCALPVLAALVDFIQLSDPQGIMSRVGEATVGEWTNTVTASATSGSLRFVGWYDHDNIRYSQTNGTAQNPAAIFILEPTTMTARYTSSTNDVDADTIPDWYELFYYGGTNQQALSDTDNDGFSLYEEWYRGYDPNVWNALSYRYREQSAPTNVFGVTELYYAGTTTVHATTSRYSDVDGARFCYWTVNAQRQADVLGRSTDPAQVALTNAVRYYLAEAKYVAATNDTDGDGVSDWYELNHNGNLDQIGTSDADGDGWSLAVEAAHDTHPGLRDEIVRSEAMLAGSEAFRFVLSNALYYTEQSSPTGCVAYRNEVFQPGTLVTASVASVCGGLRFCYWTLNGVRQTNSVGTSANPVVFPISSDVDAVAYLLPATNDLDADMIPDWYEKFYYGSTNQTPGSDTDSDGYSLYEEWYRGYDPNVWNALSYRYREQSAPTNVFGVAEQYYAGTTTMHATTARYGEVDGARFCYWTVNAQRQADALERSTDPAQVAFTNAVRYYQTEARYVAATNDTDADGVSDWYELNHYGSLDQVGSGDPDGDGWSLVVEAAHDTHPGIRDEIVRNEVMLAGSETFRFDLFTDVRYTEQSSPADYVTYRDVTCPTGTLVTASASATYGSLRFCYWTLNGQRQTNAAGTSANPVTFAITSNTDAVACLLPETADGNADSIPDWYELFYYGNTNLTAASDTDNDGYSLYEEWYRGYDPNTVDPVSYRYREGTESPDIFPASEQYVGGSVASLTTSSRYGEVDGSRFCYWMVGGLVQRDVLGRAVDPAIVPFTNAVRYYEGVAHYAAATNDADCDSVPDWYELNHYQSLGRAAAEDADGDGWSLAVEAAHDTHPALADEVVRNEVVLAGSVTFDFALREYFPLHKDVMVDGVTTQMFSGLPPDVTGLDIGANSHPALGDWDGDGDLDLFVGGSNGVMRVFENAGSPTVMNWVERTTNFACLAGCWTNVLNPAPSLGDWNHDGRADLAVGGGTGVVWLAASPGSWAADALTGALQTAFVVGSSSAVPAFADIDGDGWSDLLVLAEAGLVRCYTNTHSATVPYADPPYSTDLLGTPVPEARGIAAADVNGDGLTDVLISDENGNVWEFHWTP